MPWIEIDFAADIERATSEILPRILAAEGCASTMTRGGGETGRSLERGPVTVNGAIYAKNQIILVHSESIAGTEGLGQGTVIVGDKVEVTSSDTILDVNADFSFLPGGSPIKKPTLVE